MWHNKKYSDWNKEPCIPFKWIVNATIVMAVLITAGKIWL